VVRTVLVFRARSLGGNRNESVEDLDVFKLAHQLALKTYSTTKTFPGAETFSLVDQMRRAAASATRFDVLEKTRSIFKRFERSAAVERLERLERLFPQKEGAMRLGSREYRQFVGIARGSAGEVCYQLLLARDLKYISDETYQELRSGYDRVVQMLSRPSVTRHAPGSRPITSTSTITTRWPNLSGASHEHES
jgi:23S rRNA-intervening sequence protein